MLHPNFYAYEVPSNLQMLGDMICGSMQDAERQPYALDYKISLMDIPTPSTMHMTQYVNRNVRRNNKRCVRNAFYVANFDNGYNPYTSMSRVVVHDIPRSVKSSQAASFHVDRLTGRITLFREHPYYTALRNTDAQRASQEYTRRINRNRANAAAMVDSIYVMPTSDVLVDGVATDTVTRYESGTPDSRSVFSITCNLPEDCFETRDPVDRLVNAAVRHARQGDGAARGVGISDRTFAALNSDYISVMREVLAKEGDGQRVIDASRARFRALLDNEINRKAYDLFLRVAASLNYVIKDAPAMNDRVNPSTFLHPSVPVPPRLQRARENTMLFSDNGYANTQGMVRKGGFRSAVREKFSGVSEEDRLKARFYTPPNEAPKGYLDFPLLRDFQVPSSEGSDVHVNKEMVLEQLQRSEGELRAVVPEDGARPWAGTPENVHPYRDFDRKAHIVQTVANRLNFAVLQLPTDNTIEQRRHIRDLTQQLQTANVNLLQARQRAEKVLPPAGYLAPTPRPA